MSPPQRPWPQKLPRRSRPSSQPQARARRHRRSDNHIGLIGGHGTGRDHPRHCRATAGGCRQASGRHRQCGDDRSWRQFHCGTGNARGRAYAFGGVCNDQYPGRRHPAAGAVPAGTFQLPPSRHRRTGRRADRNRRGECAGAAERACSGNRRLRAQRQEPVRNPARSGRSRPHRRPHRCRSQRPGDVASDGRKAGNAVDVAAGRAAAATGPQRCRLQDRQTAACNFSLRDQSSSGQNSGNDTGRNAQRLIVSDDDTHPRRGGGTQLWPHARIEQRRRHQGLRRRT